MKISTPGSQEGLPKEGDAFCHSHGPHSISEEKNPNLIPLRQFLLGRGVRFHPFLGTTKCVSTKDDEGEAFYCEVHTGYSQFPGACQQDLICWSGWIFFLILNFPVSFLWIFVSSHSFICRWRERTWVWPRGAEGQEAESLLTKVQRNRQHTPILCLKCFWS